MLGSDFTNFSEADSTLTSASSAFLNSESCSSDYPGSEIDMNGEILPKKQQRSKSRHRAQKKVKYWILPTMSSGTFDPSMLTARQQLQYLAQKSKLGEESESLELSPLRLDRIKFEEMKSMSPKEQLQSEAGFRNSVSNATNSTGNANSINHSLIAVSAVHVPSSPLTKSTPSNKGRSAPGGGSKLRDEIMSSPVSKTRKITSAKKEKGKNQKKLVEEADIKIDTRSMDIATESVAVKSSAVIMANTLDLQSDPKISSFSAASTVSSNTTSTPVPLKSYSLFADMKNYLFNYNEHRQKHFETFLQNFAKRLGLSTDDEIVQRKREEIVNKGMI
jgi:hypothetical protein